MWLWCKCAGRCAGTYTGPRYGAHANIGAAFSHSTFEWSRGSSNATQRPVCSKRFVRSCPEASSGRKMVPLGVFRSTFFTSFTQSTRLGMHSTCIYFPDYRTTCHSGPHCPVPVPHHAIILKQWGQQNRLQSNCFATYSRWTALDLESPCATINQVLCLWLISRAFVLGDAMMVAVESEGPRRHVDVAHKNVQPPAGLSLSYPCRSGFGWAMCQLPVHHFCTFGLSGVHLIY